MPLSSDVIIDILITPYYADLGKTKIEYFTNSKAMVIPRQAIICLQKGDVNHGGTENSFPTWYAGLRLSS